MIPPGLNAPELNAMGLHQQAAALWASRHPYAMNEAAHGRHANIPGFVNQSHTFSGIDHAHNISSILTSALTSARDPELKQSLSNALAALHKFIQARQKEHDNMLTGKLSPRLMREAHQPRPEPQPHMNPGMSAF